MICFCLTHKTIKGARDLDEHNTINAYCFMEPLDGLDGDNGTGCYTTEVQAGEKFCCRTKHGTCTIPALGYPDPHYTLQIAAFLMASCFLSTVPPGHRRPYALSAHAF